MLADDFVEVPFFDGTLEFRLVGATGGNYFVRHPFRLLTRIDRHHRDLCFFTQVDCSKGPPNPIERAVAEAIHTLESAIRLEPWAWHPWQRLQWEHAADGSPRYYMRPLGPVAANPRTSLLLPILGLQV